MRCPEFHKCRNDFWTICPEVSSCFNQKIKNILTTTYGKMKICYQLPILNSGICSLAELDKIAYFDISCYNSYRRKLNTTSCKILLMGKPHIYTNIFLVSPNCRSCYMEASSQIQNLLCLLLLHLCSSFFHYLTLNQVGPRSEPQTETEGTI